MRDQSETDLITSTAVMPGQIPGGQRIDADVSGERALMLAVLEDAASCIIRARRQRRLRYAIRVLAADATSWVLAEDHAWPFSFVNICDVLGVDAGALRARLLSAELSSVPAFPS